MAQSCGTGVSISAAAAITEVPAGTLTCRPSMVSVTVAAPTRIGVPESNSCSSAISDLLFGRDARGIAGEILAEMVERAQHGQRRQSAERAQRPVRQHLAEIAQQLDVLVGDRGRR